VKRYVLDNGFDGVQVDCMGWGPIKGYTNAVPVDPSTNQPYTVTQWLQFSVATLNAMKDALGASKFVGFNGLANGTAYAQATKALVNSNADGGTAEGFVRDALDATDDYPTAQEWVDNLRMMSDVAAKGKAFFAWTKTWRPATDQQRANWNTFALATYLLGRGNYSYYDFLPSTAVDRTAVPYANEQANLGKPLGAYSVGAGVYSRKFEHGVVWVDPVKHTAAINVTS
jgi:hypothetical protein